jgi:8-oxo-dGTP pyrophosphatase MutT (NUDIX family)
MPIIIPATIAAAMAGGRSAATALSTIATKKCKVWIRRDSVVNSSSSKQMLISIPCPIGTSIYDSIKAATEGTKSNDIRTSSSCHYDRMIVDLEEPINGSITLSSSSGTSSGTNNSENDNDNEIIHQGIPFGRSKDCPTLSFQAKEDFKFGRRYRQDRPYASLAVVGIVHDLVDNKILITKRPSYMRSFPSAYVLPGGNVDDDEGEGESLTEAISREIQEETGLIINEKSWKLQCLWESVYPTTTTSSSTTTTGEAVIRAHHLVCYFSGQLEQKQQQQQQQQQQQVLQLCEEEVDGAVWLSCDDIRNILHATALLQQQKQQNENDNNEDDDEDASLDDISINNTNINNIIENLLQNQKIPLHHTSRSGNVDDNNDDEQQSATPTTMIPLSNLVGIYPRYNGRSSRTTGSHHLCGMAQGSLFALEELLVKNNTNSNSNT